MAELSESRRDPGRSGNWLYRAFATCGTLYTAHCLRLPAYEDTGLYHGRMPPMNAMTLLLVVWRTRRPYRASSFGNGLQIAVLVVPMLTVSVDALFEAL